MMFHIFLIIVILNYFVIYYSNGLLRWSKLQYHLTHSLLI